MWFDDDDDDDDNDNVIDNDNSNSVVQSDLHFCLKFLNNVNYI